MELTAPTPALIATSENTPILFAAKLLGYSTHEGISMNKAIINNRVYLELLSIIISQLDPNASCLECLDRNLLSASDRERDRYPINRSALNDLQVMQDEIIAVADSKAIFGYALIILLKPSIANSELAAAQKRLGEAITRINRLTDIIGLLLTNFGDSGLKLTIEVKTELGVIDLFVKMADLRNFALMLRSNGNNYIMWQKDRKQFYIRHTGIRGLKHWGTTTQILETFNLQTNWLQKVKSPIIGSTASQRKKPIIRAIVLTGETELDKLHHDPEAKVDFGRTKVVKIDAGYTTYLLQSIDLVKFLMPPVES